MPCAKRVESVGTTGPGHFIWLIYDVYDQYKTFQKYIFLTELFFHATEDHTKTQKILIFLAILIDFNLFW